MCNVLTFSTYFMTPPALEPMTLLFFNILSRKNWYLLCILIFNPLLFCKPVMMHLLFEILQFLTLYFYMLDCTIQFPAKNTPGLAERLLASCCEVSIKWWYYIFLVGRYALFYSCHFVLIFMCHCCDNWHRVLVFLFGDQRTFPIWMTDEPSF